MNKKYKTNNNKNDLVLLLKEELQLMEKASTILKYSYDICSKIGIKEEYSFEDLDKFESLTGRFARLSDLLIQKVFRLIDDIDLESPGTIRDRINRAEKKGIIESADVFIEVRVIRNQVAHEYIQDEIQGMFEKVLKYAPYLLDSVNRVKDYCQKYIS